MKGVNSGQYIINLMGTLEQAKVCTRVLHSSALRLPHFFQGDGTVFNYQFVIMQIHLCENVVIVHWADVFFLKDNSELVLISTQVLSTSNWASGLQLPTPGCTQWLFLHFLGAVVFTDDTTAQSIYEELWSVALIVSELSWNLLFRVSLCCFCQRPPLLVLFDCIQKDVLHPVIQYFLCGSRVDGHFHILPWFDTVPYNNPRTHTSGKNTWSIFFGKDNKSVVGSIGSLAVMSHLSRSPQGLFIWGSPRQSRTLKRTFIHSGCWTRRGHITDLWQWRHAKSRAKTQKIKCLQIFPLTLDCCGRNNRSSSTENTECQ